MRCSRKSTTWRAEAVAGLLAAVLAVAGARGIVAQAIPGPVEDAARTAIVKAVRERMGAPVDVTLDGLRLRGDLSGATGILATLDPSARLGVPTRVTLRGLRGRTHAVRLAEADCRIRVEVPYLEVVAPIARGEAIAPAAVRLVRGFPDGAPLKPLITEVAGARAVRALAPGDMVLHHDVNLPPAVRSGEPVQLRLAAGLLVVTMEAVATQDGEVGQDIRVVNPSSGRALRATVVGRRTVEVHHGS
jgi:flagella basal body P-ring formation protein FlgA